MSQYLLPVIDPAVTTGSQLSAWLNLWSQAVQTQQFGSTRPNGAEAGMIWVKETSSVLQELMIFDGADDLVLIAWNPSTNVVSYPGAVKGPATSDLNNIALWGGDNGDTLLDSGFEVQSSTTDTVGNKVLRLGAFGLGELSLTNYPLSTIDSTDCPVGFYRLNTGTAGARPPNMPALTGVISIERISATAVKQTISTPTTQQMWIRSFSSGVGSAWEEFWTTGNLVKQTGQTDPTTGAMMAVGAFGLGSGYPENPAPNCADFNALTITGVYRASDADAGIPPQLHYCPILHVQASDTKWQMGMNFSTGVMLARAGGPSGWSTWREFAFTTGSAFTGTTQFENIQTSGTVRSTGGQVSSADLVAFSATQLDAAGQPYTDTVIQELISEVTALRVELEALKNDLTN